MRRTILLFSFLICYVLTNAQNQRLDNFSRLEAVGNIPRNLLEIANSKEDLKDKYEENLRNQIKKFIISGKIIFGDEVSNYVNNIVDGLLRNQSKLREEINVYVIKSSQANAFATSKGYLFITTGLIAQATSEAELAFAISHEIIHYTKKHGYSLKEDFDNIDDFLTYHSRSRDQEFQCDREGYLDYYLKAGYDKDSPMGVYDILQYSYLPFDELKLDRSYFESEYYKFKDNYFLESVTPISSREGYIDTFSTHPNLKLRRAEMEKLIEKNANHIGNAFIQSKSSFELIRTLCRFETINQQIISDNYIKSYYNSIILLDKLPDNKFLLTSKIASIYGISKVKTYGNYSRYLLTRKETEGQMQFLANFFEKANKKEVALMAIREVWEGIKIDSNKYYLSLFDDIVKDLANEMQLGDLNKFSDLKMGEIYNEPPSNDEENSNLSKYDKIKSTKIVGHQKGFKSENYMLSDLKKDKEFLRRFESALQKNESKQARDLIDKLKDKEKIPDIKSLIIFEPITITFNKKKEIKKSSQTNLKLSQSFETMIRKAAKNNSISPIIMSNNSFDTSFSYQLRSKIHDFKMGLNKFGEIYYESRDLDNYAKELNSPYLNFITLYKAKKKTDKEKSYKLIYTTIAGGFAYPLLPISIYQWTKTAYTGEMQSLVYDLENNTFVSNNTITFSYENTKDFEKQALDESYKLINNKRSSYSKYGYQGRRFIFALETNLSPALLTPNKVGESGAFRFDYAFSPNVEFVLNKKLSIGAGMRYMDTKFDCNEDDYDTYPLGDLNVIGYSLFMKSYKAIAPLGYYYKFQVDYFTYTPNLKWIESVYNYDTYQYENKAREFDKKGFSMGMKFEYGKVFFLNSYLEIGAGCSFGLAFKGWGSSSIFDATTLNEYAEAKIRKAYMLGINLSIGFLPF
ncbi:MAG: M48 family metallopeptidase [Bacteroidales bacterium]|nr:M48 family metallopeptidase [Bacteroidales bacterium]MDD4683858.1 M48 family metallopeptidase [Bacteroidales bacterium]